MVKSKDATSASVMRLALWKVGALCGSGAV